MAGYGNDAGFNGWLADNGYVLPAGAPSPAVLRQRGSVYVDGRALDRLAGAPTAGLAQERAWPRVGAAAYGSTIADDVIPNAFVQASYFAAWQEANDPGSLTPAAVALSGLIKKTETGPIKTEYFGSGDALADSTVVLPAVERLIAPFLLDEEPTVAFGIFSVG